MQPPKITRRDIIAGLVGAAILALLAGLAGCGPWRYAPISSERGLCYIIDTWSGSARLWIVGDEEPMRTLRQQRRDLVAQRRDLVAQLRAEARHERDTDGTDCLLIQADVDAAPVLVAPHDLEAYVEAHPRARPAH